MELTRFQKKALDYSKHISLTANAGSGKTFILSKRYVEIASNENIHLNNIVAITFTEKAASELYKRISNEIEDRYLSTDDISERKKLNRIRRQLVSANISTIHSFCISILKEFPLEAGIDANFSPIDPITSKELIELSINEYINKNLEYSEDEDLKDLLRIFGTKSIFVNQIFRLIEKRKKILSLSEKLYSLEIEEIADYFRQLFDEYFEIILTDGFNDFVTSVKIINNSVLSDKNDNTFALEIDFLIQQLDLTKKNDENYLILQQISEQLLTQKGEVKKRGYLKKQFVEDLSEEMEIVEDYLEKINSFEISENRSIREEELASFGKKLINVFLNINYVYEQKKKTNGFLDFEDILLLAKKILAENNVKQSLGEKFKYIMIDEYQDTNEIQYEIFMPILYNLKKGNLFVVGDEKQSIYKFRDADLELFNRTKNDIKNESDEESLLMLPHSFRVSPPVALFANKLFEKLFDSPNLSYNEVSASELICASKDKPGHIEFLISHKDEKLSEAEFLARRIDKLMSEDPELDYSDIAILCRKRNSFGELEDIFTSHNMPFKIVGGKGFYQQQLVFDIYNYLAFITNPDNDLALVGLLRSPFINISDTELFRIKLKKGITFWEKFKKFAEDESENYISKVNEVSENISLVNKIDIGQLIRKILNESSYWSIISYSQDSEQDIANLEKLIRIANSYSSQSYKTIFDFLEYLKDSMESFADEGQATLEANNESIQIMTIHQSKGLEFKVVFLYNCNDITSTDNVKSKSVAVDNNFGILTKLPPQNNYFVKYEAAPIIGMFDYIEGKKEIAEVKRLLYVALTRAVNYLFISAEKNKSFRKNSFISLICDALKIDVEEAKFNLSGGLKFLKDSDNDEEENLEIEIPILKILDPVKKAHSIVTTESSNKKVLSEQINDHAKREIISASKMAVFSQCERKYELTYEFGYSKLFMKFYDLINRYEFQAKEEDSIGSLSAVKGKVIHKVLEDNISAEDLSTIIPIYIDEEIGNLTTNEKERKNIINNIISDLVSYYKSSSYEFINQFLNFYNEYEVYSKEGENYLHGIIDKLIFKDNLAIIADYKTDDIDKDEIKERGEVYLPQLKFYAYLISKLFSNIDSFEVRLIFIKHPEKNYIKQFTKEGISEFESSIKNYVEAIKNKKFGKNTKHCQKCYFFLNKKMCIYDKVNN